VLGKNQQEGEDKSLDQAGSGDRFTVQGDECLMKHSCSINVVTHHRQVTCALSLTRPAMPGRLCRLLSGSAGRWCQFEMLGVLSIGFLHTLQGQWNNSPRQVFLPDG
jgi:hypothetical protein